jgi:hypothetical protein
MSVSSTNEAFRRQEWRKGKFAHPDPDGLAYGTHVYVRPEEPGLGDALSKGDQRTADEFLRLQAQMGMVDPWVHHTGVE